MTDLFLANWICKVLASHGLLNIPAQVPHNDGIALSNLRIIHIHRNSCTSPLAVDGGLTCEKFLEP